MASESLMTFTSRYLFYFFSQLHLLACWSDDYFIPSRVR